MMAAACAMLDVHREGLASHRYVDSQGRSAIKLLPNEYFVTAEDLVLTTVLGSCVAACLRDPVAGVGGMNHFMLPVASRLADAKTASTLRYGAYAMDVLIRALIAGGARRERLETKVFGGGQLLGEMQLGRVGQANAEFVLAYLKRGDIRLLAQDLGDSQARQVRYCPASGAARVRRLGQARASVIVRERALVDTLSRAEHPSAGVYQAAEARG